MFKFIVYTALLVSLVTSSLANELFKTSGTADHFCCDVETTTETTETRTKTVSYIETYTTQVISNYTYCPPVDHGGIIDHIISNLQNQTDSNGNSVTKPLPTIKPCLSRPIYSTVTHQRVTYKTETYLVPVVTVNCPEEHISCCDGYIMFNKQCIPKESWDSIQDLINMGIIGK